MCDSLPSPTKAVECRMRRSMSRGVQEMRHLLLRLGGLCGLPATSRLEEVPRLKPTTREVSKPPLPRRAWFYAGGTLPDVYEPWVQAKLESRAGFLAQHFVGSVLLFVALALPIFLVVDGDERRLVRVMLIGVGMIATGTLLFAGRFRRHAVRQHSRRWSRDVGRE